MIWTKPIIWLGESGACTTLLLACFYSNFLLRMTICHHIFSYYHFRYSCPRKWASTRQRVITYSFYYDQWVYHQHLSKLNLNTPVCRWLCYTIGITCSVDHPVTLANLTNLMSESPALCTETLFPQLIGHKQMYSKNMFPFYQPGNFSLRVE